MNNIENEVKLKVEEKPRKKSVIYENIDLKVETVDKILVGLFILIAVVFAYAITY